MHYQSTGSSLIHFCCPSSSVAAVGGWETRAGGRSVVERLYAELSNTTTPSPAPHTGFLSMGISSEGGAPVEKFSNFMFVAVIKP